MKRLVRAAAALYPGRWRARYGAELDALIEEAGGGWRELADVSKGAMAMQIRWGGWRRMVAGCAMAGLLTAGAIAWQTPARYQSVAVMRIAARGAEESVEPLSGAERTVLSRSSLSRLIQQYGLYGEERKREPLEEIVGRMRNRDLQIRMVENERGGAQGEAFAIAFQAESREQAQAVVREMTAQFGRALEGSGTVEVLDAASLPERAVGPSRAATLASGLALGAVAGLLLAGLLRAGRRVPARAWRFAGAGALAGLAAGALLAWRAPAEYRSIAVLRVAAKGDAERAGSLERAEREILSRRNLAAMIQQYNLYSEQRKSLPLEEIVDGMRNRQIRIQLLQMAGSRRPAQAFSVTFEGEDPHQAQAVTMELTREFLTALGAGAPAEVLDPASLPVRPFAPNRAAWMAAGMVLGLAGGWLLLGLSRSRTPRSTA